jgi:branched-chain amino acid transport system substrate-binding protein
MGGAMQTRRSFLESLAAAGTLATVEKVTAQTQETIKIGFLVGMTGQLANLGNEMVAATKFFIEQNGTAVAGKKVELIIRDDASVPDQAKRIAQELVVNNKVAILAGCLSTPVALAIASISAEAKVPQIVMGASTSIITERSPYIVRTFSTQAQLCAPMAQWAIKNSIMKVVTLVSDYAPGYDTEKSFSDEFKANGGEIIRSLRVPFLNPDVAPSLQRARDAKPDALFVWLPASSVAFSRQYAERGLLTAGIKLIGTGDVVDDETLDQMNDSMLGVVTTFQYSVAHPSEANKAFVEGMKRFNKGTRPNHMAVSAYDGMHLIYEALKKTGGSTDGDALIAAMKGMAWQSPRGQILIDPETRDIVQDIYVRRLQRVNGELYNVEFDKFDAVKDPIKAVQKI